MSSEFNKSSRELFRDVINEGLCTFCGACSGACPYLMPKKGSILLLDSCTLTEGQCYHYCPRTYADMDALSRTVFEVPYSKAELGVYKDIFMARSTDPQIRDRAQYGGTATTLFTVALEEGLLDGALLSRMSDDKSPMAVLARNKAEILECAGSTYVACPLLQSYNEINENSLKRLGLVAVPCQNIALAKMKNDPPRNRVNIDNVKLIIGLFCTWALSPDEFYEYLNNKIDLAQVTKFDVPPPPAERFDIYASDGKISLPLDKVREFIMPACAFCHDMTSEFADISIGSSEGYKGWNTVIARTDTGVELLKTAKEKGRIEIDEIRQSNLDHLKYAALNKKKRALTNIMQKSGERSNLLYLGLREEIVQDLLDK